MKRSEMLEKMVFSMELHAGNDPAWLDSLPGLKAGALDYANKILRDLEEAGMLPPPTKTDAVTSYLVYCYYPEVTGNATDQLDITNSQLWEPEDD